MTDIRAEDVYRAIAVLREHCGNLYDTYGFDGSCDRCAFFDQYHGCIFMQSRPKDWRDLKEAGR